MSLSPSFASYIITYQRICFLFLKLTISSIDSVIVYYKFIANILKDEGCVTERVMRPMSSLKSIVQPNVLNLFQCFQYAVFLFSRSGAGQQCCYKGDSLMVGPPGAGTLDVVSPDKDIWGHFRQDVLPWFACCFFSRNCEKYYQRRPSDDGKDYVPPRFGE